MAALAGDVAVPRPREILALLAPFPGRLGLATRIALVCALTVLVTSAYGTPEAAISAYIVFFLIRPDRVTSAILSVALLLLITVIIGIVLAVAIFCIDAPALRVACIAVLSIGFLFLASASKLRPVGAILAMIVGFGLDELGLAPLGEAATRGLLYAWLMVAIPVGVALCVNLLVAPSPRKLANALQAKRLRLAARMLAGRATGAERSAFGAVLRGGNRQLTTWLKLSKLEGTSTAADSAALGHAAEASTAILLAVDLATREPEATLPAALAASLADTLDQMAAMLGAGGYPVDIALELPDATELPPLAALVLAELRAAIEGFATPQAAAGTKPAAPASGHAGFFEPDAWSNPDHVRYALKTTAAAMFCYVLYQQLDWPGIHTCFITCYMVSLGTMAETVEKLTLRIAGCLAGALLGTLIIVFLIPSLTSVGELLVLVFAGAWLAAWVATGGPRISYAGMQIAFAFFLCVVQGAAPGFNLVLARDRVIGVLLGNLVVYLVFTRVWPVSIEKSIDKVLAALVGQWTAIARVADAGLRRTLAAGALARYDEVRQGLGLVHYEPSWVRPGADWIASRRRALAELGALEAPLFFAAGRAAASTDARLQQVAARFADGDTPTSSRATADAPAPEAPIGGAEPDAPITVADPEASITAAGERMPGASDGGPSAWQPEPGGEAQHVAPLLSLIDARLADIAGMAQSPEPTEASDAQP